MSEPRIFLSHAEEDNAFAERLAHDLRAHDLDVWLDTSHITGGDILDRINKALVGRDLLLLVLSPAALTSDWVPAEVNASIMRSKQKYMRDPVVVIARSVPLKDIPPLWTVYSRIDATRDYDAELPNVLRAIDPSFAIPPPPDTPQPEASSQAPAATPVQAGQGALSARLARYRRLLVLITAAVLVFALVFVAFSQGFLNARSSVNTSATQTVNANASATTAADMTAVAETLATETAYSATATADTIATATALTVRYPYAAPAPGPKCDTGVAPWQTVNNTGDTEAVSCVSNPTRTHLVLTCGPGSGCGAGVSLITGTYFTLPSRYTISVAASGVGSGGSANINLHSVSPYTWYAVALFPNGYYNMCRATNPGGACTTVGQGFVNAGTKATLALQVSGSDVRGSVNGTVVATVPDANMATNSATSSDVILGLWVFGSSGAHADFANFKITQP
jgi:TIR domain